MYSAYIYILNLISSCTFDSTEYTKELRNQTDEDKIEPIDFPMDMDFVIEGLRIGMIGQCNHEKRKIWIPKELVTGGQKVFSGK